MAFFGREPASVAGELLLRPRLFRVFVSSKMRDGAFATERVAAAEAIESTGLAEAWYWERDAAAGPYCSTEICIGRAKTSDGIVLLLGETLTDITAREYRAAKRGGALCIVLVAQGVARDASAQAFLARERNPGVTVNFGSMEEVRTRVVNAIHEYMITSARRQNIERRRRPWRTWRGA